MKHTQRSKKAAGDPQETLQITVPQSTKRSLKVRAAESGEPMRLIILKALLEAGISVPNEELHDRRKSK
jgi:hypothetical protein